MCGERNLPDTAVICIYAPDTRRQYYCFQCWLVISERAAVDVPDLMRESKADAQMIGVMFGIKSARKRDSPENIQAMTLELRPDGTIDTDLDLRVRMRCSLLVDGVPFKRYHLTGDALKAHIARVHGASDDG